MIGYKSQSSHLISRLDQSETCINIHSRLDQLLQTCINIHSKFDQLETVD